MIRISRRKIPPNLKYRQKEILGEIRGDTMVDCVYNAVIADELSPTPPLENINEFLPAFVKDYQVEDLSLSMCRRAVFNINKPGYGKTLETILWIQHILEKGFKALVLCPKSVISTWEAQLNKYWPSWKTDGMWWITNYEQLYNQERLQRALAFQWDVIVLDESHTIKSFKSKITQICFKLKGDARHCLTGTPIKNRPEDLAAQLKWLDPFSITSYTDFQNAFCHMQKDAWGEKPCGLTKDKVMVENLQKLLALYTVGGQERNTGSKEPNKIKVRLKLDPAVKKLYKQVEGEYNKELKQKVIDTASLMEQGIKVSNAVEASTRRLQLASNPQVFNPSLGNVKFDWIVDWLNGTDEKVVIFSRFAKTVEALETLLKSKKVLCSKVVGGQTEKARAIAIEQWKKCKQVLLGTYGALGEGVDGLQHHCCYMIFIDRHWNASDNEQAEKRLVRTGQTQTVTIYVLQAIGTIDIKIERVQLNKGFDAHQLLSPVGDDEE